MEPLSTTTTTSTTSAVPALTTTFTPAASCLTDLYVYSVVSGGYLWDYRQLGPSTTATDCFPPGFTATTSAYFSPGICPTFYSIACSTVVNIGTVTETRATCCPSAYSCQADKTAWPWYSTELCTYQGSATSTYLFTASESISTAIGLANLNAYGMEIRWQASDTSTPSTTSASTTASSTLSTSVSASPASTALSTSPPTSTPTSASSSSLSTGAKAGIGIGAAVGALIILTGIIFFFIRRRRNNAAANKQDSMNMHFTPGQLQQQQYYVEAAAGEVQSKTPLHELSAQGREKGPVELSSDSYK